MRHFVRWMRKCMPESMKMIMIRLCAMASHFLRRDVLCVANKKDVFEKTKFPELSKAVKYFKETEGGFGEMCKTVEDYAKDYAEEREEIAREEERKNAIRKMLVSGLSREMILSMNYSEKELKAVETELS